MVRRMFLFIVMFLSTSFAMFSGEMRIGETTDIDCPHLNNQNRGVDEKVGSGSSDTEKEKESVAQEV